MRILEKLANAIREYDKEGASQWAADALAGGIEPREALETVAETLGEIGDGFSAGTLWLPDLIAAADAARAGLDIIEARILQTGEQVRTLGTVVLGTVAGDLHSIGKSMVGAFLTASGFRVIDLGTNVPRTEFIAAAQRHGADLLGMSALLTTTMQEQRRVVEALSEAGLRDRTKVMVGGGAITAEFAAQIGADGYGASAPDAAVVARKLLGV